MRIEATQAGDGQWIATCTRATCGKTFMKPGKTAAEAAARMHVNRAHNRKIPTYVRGLDQKPAEQTESKPRKQVAKAVLLNFCPGCGLDLSRVALGMALGKE